MKITLICNCGLLLEQDGQKLLVDGLMEHYLPFYRQPEEEIEKLLAGEGVYEGLVGAVYTHLHPDHYDAALTAELERRQGVPVYRPSWEDPARHSFRMGPFDVTSVQFDHTPVFKPYSGFVHCVLLIRAGGKSVYVTSDAYPDGEKHTQLLQDGVDAAFWNSQNLSYEPIRRLMAGRVRQNYIYHMPGDPQDRMGFRRKAETNFRRFAQELTNTRMLLEYPSTVEV